MAVEEKFDYHAAAMRRMVAMNQWSGALLVTDLRNALSELYAMVRGECPSLLNEDSGGNAKLALEIEDLLNSLKGY